MTEPTKKKVTTKKRDIKADTKTKTDDDTTKVTSGSGAIEVMLA